jgi:hypothetical protein
MASKATVIKFGPQNKSSIKGKVRHTRTGACTCNRYQKCYHGKKR